MLLAEPISKRQLQIDPSIQAFSFFTTRSPLGISRYRSGQGQSKFPIRESFLRESVGAPIFGFQAVDQTAVSHPCSSSTAQRRELHAHASSRCGEEPPGNNRNILARATQYDLKCRAFFLYFMQLCITAFPDLFNPDNLICYSQSTSTSWPLHLRCQ